jgi:hypothetical protein
VLPPVGRTHTPDGARLFAEFWLEALDWGYATTDSTLARRLYSPACTDCARFMHNFDDTRRKGHYLMGGRSTITAAYLASNERRHGAEQAVDVTIRVAALIERDQAGHIVSRAVAIPSLTYRVWLAWQHDVWKVVDTKEVVVE